MTNIGVIGLGNWGSALAHHLAAKGNSVIGWSRNAEIVKHINSHHLNPAYLKGVRLHPRLQASSQLEEVCEADVLVLAVPSATMEDISGLIKVKPKALVVSAIKGIEANTLLTPTFFFAQKGIVGRGIASLSGPSFARDIAENRPCGVVMASADESIAKECAEIFVSDTMRVYISTDTLGVELGGAVKNVIALAVGACDGLALGESARAGLITRGLAEMMRLIQAMGADSRTLAGLSGLGDLIMTATSETSRNHQVGFRLGRGERLQDILKTVGSVAEGVHSASLVSRLAEKFGVSVPITNGVCLVLADKASPRDMIGVLISRPIKREFE